MDFKVKGISWVGNVYQKFEAMCLEVEDVVCQETAKYVETQVQTVGSSVKKFYAEVLQDLLPPSSLDHKENEGSGLPLENSATIGTYEKSKQSSKEEPECEIHYKVSETKSPVAKIQCHEKIDDVVTCKKSKKGAGMHASNERPLQTEKSEVITETDPILLLEDNGNNEMCKKVHAPTNTDSLVASLPPPDLLELAPSAEKKSSRESSFDSLFEGHAKACDTHVDMHSPVSFDLQICNSNRNTGTSCTKAVVEFGGTVESPSPPLMSLIPPGVPCERRIVENVSDASSDISTDSNAGVITSATIDTASLNKSSWSEPEQFTEDGIQATANNSDDDYSELESNDDIVELASETIDMYQNAKLEESCIVVDSIEVPSVPHQAGRPRSYKKKIRDALASRMRLAKKPEHEQLPVWHVETNSPQRKDGCISTLTMNESKEPPNSENGDSEWELL